jgi:hypothetical protein
MVCIFVKAIKRKLIENIQGNQQKACKTDGQAENIDEGKNLVLFQVPPGNLKIISKHNLGLILLSIN